MSSAPAPRPIRPLSTRRLVFSLLLVLLAMGLLLHNGGYAVLIAKKTPQLDTRSGLTVVSCTYFTGTSKVIKHLFWRIDDKSNAQHPSSGCPFVTRVPTANAANPQ